AEGTLRLSPEGGQQVVALDLALAGLRAYGVSVGEARIEGRVLDALGTPRLDLDVTAERIVSGDMRLATATLTAEGLLSAVEIVLRAAGEMNGKPLTLSAAARADLAGAAVRVTVTQMQLAIGDDRFELLAPLTVVSGGSTLRVEDLAVALPDGGRLTGEFASYGGPLAGTILLEAPDLSFLDRAFDIAVESGALRVAATFDTRPGSAGADITVTGRDIVAADISGAGPVSVDASLDWNGAILDLDLRAAGDFERPLLIEATVPVRATGGLPRLAESGPVSVRVDWEGEIGDIWALVPMPGHVVTGNATIDIGVTGDISSPVFTGGIVLEDGIYQNLDYGLILTGLSLATTIESTGGQGMRLETVDGADANVRLEGRVGLDEQGIDLTLETRQPVIVRRDDAIVRLDADLRIYQEPDGRLVVAGTIEIPEAEIRLVNANPPGIVTLGEVRIKGQPLVFEDEAVSLPIGLEIEIVAPKRIFVRGRGLTSEWSIDLDVRGTVSQPRITGEIAAVRGDLDLIGREFALERGRVLFNGGPVINPRLDVSLVRETDDITGRIIISGSAFDPELTFSSTPALPPDEVLPRLLFGTSSQALTPAQGLQLALGLATLLNGGGGTLDQLRAGLGLDALAIEQGDDGAALEVGKQVAEDVWVGTRQSLEGGGTTVAVEIDVFENVDVYGEVETGGETAVGVQWQKDF
ncbi:MAG TPA: translocation/assembly module TamB domain-containing protein, partial [Paracoccaceae bacterium]|nr:translocation/assembly module TamB domain-containing protein [Paracoccaceae bacterium]